jgi:hypothetical protein
METPTKANDINALFTLLNMNALYCDWTIAWSATRNDKETSEIMSNDGNE